MFDDAPISVRQINNFYHINPGVEDFLRVKMAKWDQSSKLIEAE